jgi:hypothetical protein
MSVTVHLLRRSLAAKEEIRSPLPDGSLKPTVFFNSFFGNECFAMGTSDDCKLSLSVPKVIKLTASCALSTFAKPAPLPALPPASVGTRSKKRARESAPTSVVSLLAVVAANGCVIG